MQREQHQDHSGNFPQSWAKNAKVFILAAVFVLICFGFGCGESVEKVNLPPGRPDAQLLTYTSKGDLRAVKYLIVKLKADPNAMVVSSSGDSALHIAVEKNYSDIVLYLLKKKANVNAKNSLGETPLAIAVQQNNLELAQILLKSKAKVNVESSFGRVFMQCQNKTGWHTLYENRLKRLNQGARSLVDRASSHTTVRAVRHTAVRQLRRSASFTPTRPELNLSGRYFRCIAPFLWLFPAVHALRHSFILGFHPTFNDVAHFRGILRSRHDTTFRTCRNYCRSALPGSPVLWPLLTSRRSVMHHCMS